jgi:hypothetical protein
MPPEWEVVEQTGGDVPTTVDRLAVDGGYLYRVRTPDQMAVTFVPEVVG